MVKDKIKEKERSKSFYEKHKGKPVEHPEKNCIICGDKYIQKHLRQITCGKESCQIERRRQHDRMDWRKRREHHLIRKKKSYDKDSTKARYMVKRHYEAHKEEKAKYSLEYYHRKYKTDENFRMRRLLGNALRYVITSYIKSGRIMNPMRKYHIDWKGIMKVLTPIPQLRSKYDVDHIIPLSKFNLTDFEQVHLAFAPENHRWLTKKQNNSRSKLKRKRFSI